MVHELAYRDKVVIPDKYNTGVQFPSLLIPASEKFSDWDKYITPTIITRNGGYTFENILFSGQITVKANQVDHALYFKNCKFEGSLSGYAIKDSDGWTANSELHFDHCEFYNYESAAVKPLNRTTFKNCKIHHIKNDGLKAGFSNGGFENCYIYDIGLDKISAHADGVQTQGYNANLYIKNCRFDVPATSLNVGNAGVFFQQDADSVDAEIKDVMINGGNYGIYITISSEHPTATITGLTGSNIKIGEAYRYGKANIGIADYQNWTTNGTITSQDKLFVSSVFMGANGKIKVHASNYTLGARTLILVSDKETQTYTVPAHPSVAESSEVTFDDLPYDIEYEIEGNYVTCYDGSVADSNEIRFAYANVSELFGDIADSIRAKTGGTDLIPRENIPYEISQIGGGGLPSYLSIIDVVLESNSDTLTFSYDTTRDLLMFTGYITSSMTSSKAMTGFCYKRSASSGSNYLRCSYYTDNNGSDLATTSYGGASFDTENGTITVSGREGYTFRSGKTYRISLYYAES